MRIEELRFCNLNSLVGEWVVDFTCSDYAVEGLFAITGPTGAGKSTILDAICLALYGRTPRLAGISANSNEIMSRQTGECRAEVTFASRHGRFRCSWHQKRARNKPGGTLQPIERSFADAESGEVLHRGIKNVSAAVEASTGMDFDRFTRSVMLAQGGFAAFLLSEPEQRSRILESLTGTAIYSGISAHVHVRHSEEKRALESLKSRLEGISLLSDEEEQIKRDEMAGKRQQQAILAVEQASTEKALIWLRDCEQLRAERARLEIQKAALLEQHAIFEPQRRVLRRAEKAQELSPAFTELTLVTEAQANEHRLLDAAIVAVPALEQQVLDAQQRHVVAEKAVTDAKKTHETAAPALREAEKLDALLAEKSARLQEETTALAAAEAEHAALKAAHQAHQQELALQREALATLHKEMDAHAVDKGLVESLTGLEERFAHVRRVHLQLQDAQKAEIQARKTADMAEKTLAEQVVRTDALRKAESDARTCLEARQASIHERLQGRELSSWRAEMTALMQAKNRLLAMQDVQTRRHAGRVRQQELQTTATALEKQLQARHDAIVAGEKEYARLTQEVHVAECEAGRLRVMAGLAAHRAQLTDGAECPLCGAVHHPFAQSDIPAPDSSLERLAAAKSACEKARCGLESLRIQQAKDNAVMQDNAARQAEQVALETELAERFQQLSTDSDGLPDVLFTDLEQASAVAERITQVEASLLAVTTLLAGVESDEKLLSGLRTALQTATDKAAQAEITQATCKQALAAAHADHARLCRESTAFAESLQKLLYALQGEIVPFGESSITLELLDVVLNRLRTRREHWQGLATRDIGIQQSVAALDARIVQEAARISGEATQFKSRTERLQHLSTEHQQQLEHRLRLFAGESPAKEEARLAGLVVSAEADRKAIETQLVDVRQALAARNADIVRLRVEIAQRSAHLQTLHTAFTASLRVAGFADQVDFLDARIDAAVYAPLAAEERRLDDERTGLEANLRQLSDRLAALQEAPQTTASLPELETVQREIAEALRTLHTESGALEQALNANAEAKHRHTELFATIKLQQDTTERWASLNALIGSADGKKYSKFAQGITFEIMLDHANRQLQAMRDRYLLVRDANLPLTLNVIDSYQAGEVRTTANLSGGESFLVSLALALGLSRMASQNVRVDSLFLDEGFGSLDEDALETALSTISSLREEGKLIGIISHVPAIKERVSTQIVVKPFSGGRSRLQGAGVTCGFSADTPAE